MKKKVRVKSLPKAQFGIDNIQPQGIKAYPSGQIITPKPIAPYMMGLGIPLKEKIILVFPLMILVFQVLECLKIFVIKSKL